MAPKLRPIRTAPRDASVSRSAVAAAVKAVVEERNNTRSARDRKKINTTRAKRARTGNA